MNENKLLDFHIAFDYIRISVPVLYVQYIILHE